MIRFLPLLTLAVLLLTMHALLDFPLQGTFLATMKNHRTNPRGVPSWPRVPWGWPLFWHAWLHAVGVVWITGSYAAGLVELVSHAGIDYLKSEGRLSFTVDQWAHIAVKGIIIALRVRGIV